MLDEIGPKAVISHNIAEDSAVQSLRYKQVHLHEPPLSTMRLGG